jgi:hypothetical protein
VNKGAKNKKKYAPKPTSPIQTNLTHPGQSCLIVPNQGKKNLNFAPATLNFVLGARAANAWILKSF